MPTPDDALEISCALRLGRYIAEARGRNRPAGPQPSGNKLPRCDDHFLPLRIERTAAEQPKPRPCWASCPAICRPMGSRSITRSRAGQP